MGVKIVTDSTSDLPQKVAEELGITVVPLNVQFGMDSFRDGIDINADEFYRRLLARTDFPKTSAPAPGVFKECYQKLAGKDGIVSIHISSKLSGTYEAALAGKRDAGDSCRIEVINTFSVSMGVGLLAIVAAEAARNGATIDEVTKLVQDGADRLWIVALFDTLEFLQKGGRMGKAQAWLGSLLSIKPLLSVQEGEVVPIERVRTRSKAIDRIYEMLKDHLPANQLAVLYSTDTNEADKLISHVKQSHPQQQIYLARFGPVLGTYMGPGGFAVITLD
jgi:DegV family protein with EDD domain